MHPLVPSSSNLLGLPTPSPDNTSELRDTLISELLPNPEHEESSLQTLGCTATDTNTTTNFLLTTLLAHRILQQKSPPSRYQQKDRQLADALSRLTLALGKPPLLQDSSTSLSAYITSLRPNLPKPSALISQPLNDQQMKTLQTIQSRLHEEHQTRVQLLLTRFNVTVSAFAQSPRANRQAFFYDKHTEQMTRNAEAVSLYQAIAATRHVLKQPKGRTSAASVKNFIMGSVPDRGGRLEKPFMPAFKGRIPPLSEMQTGKKKKVKGKGRSKGKRRQFDSL